MTADGTYISQSALNTVSTKKDEKVYVCTSLLIVYACMHDVYVPILDIFTIVGAG